MSTLLQCRDLSYSAGSEPLFEQLALTLRRGDRVGLVGHNGSGKSTLLALLSGKLRPHSGSVEQANQCLTVLVEQYLPEQLASLTLWQALAERLAGDESEQQSNAWLVDKWLADVGLSPVLFEVPAGQLSGGQQNRLLLARALILEPDLLLLDEPSNHLDLASYLWLEQLLSNSSQTFVLVSHDRRLLDSVTNHTWWLRDNRVNHFALPFSQARTALFEADEAAQARRDDEEKELARLRASAKRLAIWGKTYDNEKFARKAQSMFKRIDKLDQEKTEVSQGSPLSLSLSLNGARLNAKRWLTIEQAEVKVPGKTLFTVESCYVAPGERIALLGANGTGKSTLIMHLLAAQQAQEPDAESAMRFHPRTQLGLYDQEQALLEPDWDLDTALSKLTEADSRTRKMALISAGFPYLRHQDRIGQLSGGEKSRVLFTALALNSPDSFILDEPTNHLDIEGKEQLEEQLKSSQASLLLVSHDREFVEQVCQRFWVISDGRLVEALDAEAAYALIADELPAEPEHVSGQVSGAAEQSNTRQELAGSEEQLLERLLELEQLLEEDLARKTKFQKPERQQAWQREIREIESLLNF